jgi:hypothetical protein
MTWKEFKDATERQGVVDIDWIEFVMVDGAPFASRLLVRRANDTTRELEPLFDVPNTVIPRFRPKT